MNVWIIADTHFGHSKLVDIGVRPNNVNQLMLKGLHCIQDGDLLIHLGDFALKSEANWCSTFFTHLDWDVHTILVRGNHDSKSIGWYLNRGWDAVVDSFHLDMYGKNILFTHEPREDLSGYDLNIHGHLHDTEVDCPFLTDRHILIKMEPNYKPVTLKSLIK